MRGWRAWLLAVCAVPVGARAEPLRLAITNSGIYLSAFVAQENGYFAAHGLDVTIEPVVITSTMPAALMSGSVQIAGPSTPVFLQAVDGGIDLVALAGSALATPDGRNEALLAPAGSAIHAPADLAGRRVGVPGIGTIMDVIFRHWLAAEGVDQARVSFVEVGMARVADALRSGVVDAAVANDPVLFRILRQVPPPGYVVYYMRALPGALPIVLYVARRDWAVAHPAAVAGFRAATKDGAAFALAHPDAARAIMAKHLHVSDAVLADMELPELAPAVTADQLARMAAMMRAQDMLHGTLAEPAADVTGLLAP